MKCCQHGQHSSPTKAKLLTFLCPYLKGSEHLKGPLLPISIDKYTTGLPDLHFAKMVSCGTRENNSKLK